jgi:hypothetical protein
MRREEVIVRFQGYEINGVVHSFCPACKRWSTDHHGEVEVVGPAPPEVLQDVKRLRSRGPHYHHRNRLGHELGNARVKIDNGEVSIDMRTTAYHFTGDGLYAWRGLANRYGRSVLETPHFVTVERVEDVDGFFQAVGKDIEKWVVREACRLSPR